MLSRGSHLGLAAIIYVAKRLALDRPFERFDTRRGFSCLENHVEQGSVLKEAKEGSVAIVSIELLEISPKRFAQQWVEGRLVSVLAIESIVRKYIACLNFGFESKLDVVAEEDVGICCEEIARDAIVVCGDMRC